MDTILAMCTLVSGVCPQHSKLNDTVSILLLKKLFPCVVISNGYMQSIEKSIALKVEFSMAGVNFPQHRCYHLKPINVNSLTLIIPAVISLCLLLSLTM